jgi:hypothetical protein
MAIQPPHGLPPGESEGPDFDLHELNRRVRLLEQASQIYRRNILDLIARVDHLEGQLSALLGGKFTGDLRIDGTLTVRDDIVLGDQ